MTISDSALPHPLIAEFEAIRMRQSKSREAVALVAHLNYTSLSNWIYGTAHPRLENFDAALRALGYRLAIVPVNPG